MTNTGRQDRELLATARLIENLAARVHAVRDHVATELATVDSFPDHTPGASDPDGTPSKPLSGTCATLVPIGDGVFRSCGRYRPCGEHDSPVTLTPVERAAAQRIRLAQSLTDFDARCKLLVVAASDAMREADAIIGTRLVDLAGENPNPECRDGQFGKGGSIEWGDPTCESVAVKSSLCMKHYWAWYRWRKEHDAPTPEIAPTGDVA